MPIEDARGLKVTVLCEERMLIAVPADHPLAGRKSVKIEMLAAEPFISYPPPEGPSFEGIFVSACQRAGFYPRVVQYATQMLTKLSFVSGGLGIALIPGSMRVVQLDNVAYLEIDAGKTPLAIRWPWPRRSNRQPRHYRIRRHREQIRGPTRARDGNGNFCHLAAIAMISTLRSAEASAACTVARAGAAPGGSHASQTAFISAKFAISVSQICADNSLLLSLPP